MSDKLTCSCVKSKCLVLYCECYSKGITCNDECVCIDCNNTAERAGPKREEGDERQQQKEPPKMSRAHPVSRWEARALNLTKKEKGIGCTCKNNKCLKKYCVCFNANLECSVGRCRCIDCKNPHGNISSQSQAAAAASAVVIQTAEDMKCTCTKNNCLKLYCGCFRQDVVCNSNCICIECKNTEEESGPKGERTFMRNEVLRKRPNFLFKTPKKKSGIGCSCTRNKCVSKYCDCNSRGAGCDPSVCTCINCENMMKPLSEMLDSELQAEDEDETEVFIPAEPVVSKIKGLENFGHLIDDFEDRPLEEKVTAAYEAAEKVTEEEANVRAGLEEEIKQLEAQLSEKVKKENAALDVYRRETNKVMCLELEEPSRWNDTYQQLKRYVIKTGDLPPLPSACTNEADRRLSIWVQEMKSLVYSKSERIINAPHRIEALESLGVEWIESSEDRWNKMYQRLAAYKKEHGTATLPSFMQCRKSKDKDLSALRHWVDQQEQDVQSGAMAKRLDRLKKLQGLGLPLKLSWEQEWDVNVVELLKFRSKHGHLNISGDGHSDLEGFVSELLKRLKKGSTVKLTKEEMYDLRSKGLLNDLKNPSGRQSAKGQAESVKLVPLDRVQEINYWAGMLAQLKAYQAEHGTLELPPLTGSGSGQYANLRGWMYAQRQSYENKTLEESRIKSLSELGFDFGDPWETAFRKLKKFKREAGTARLPKAKACKSDYGGEPDAELVELCKWVQTQIALYRKDELDAEKKKRLRELGVHMKKQHMGKAPWEDRFDEMMDYYHANKTCLPKRNGPLRQWVLELVDLIQSGYVSKKRQKIIDEAKIAPFLKPEVIFKESEPASTKRKAAPSDDVSGGGKKSRR